MEDWEVLPDGRVAAAMFTGWSLAVAPPAAAAVRLLFVRDEATLRSGKHEAVQLGFTRSQLVALGNALLEAANQLEEVQ